MALTQADFTRLVHEHGPTLYRVAYRIVGDAGEAEDLVQEAFRSAWKSRHRYQPDQGDRAWLMTILRRRAADRWRTRRLPSVLGVEHLEVADTSLAPDEPEPYCDEVQEALDRLPAAWREALLLVVVGELTHQQAADVLRVPLGTVLSRVSRARERLRQHLAAPARDES